MTISDILKDSNYKLTQFNEEQVKKIEEAIIVKEVNGKNIPYLSCVVRKKEMRLTPEEIIRQLYAIVLRDNFGYSTDRMEFEYAVSFGRVQKKTDAKMFLQIK